MLIIAKRLFIIFSLALCTSLFFISNAAAFLNDQFSDQNDNLIFSQQDYDSEPPEEPDVSVPDFPNLPNDNFDTIQLEQPEVTDSTSTTDILGTTTAETNAQLTQLLLLQELFAPFTNDTGSFNDAGFVPYRRITPTPYYTFDNIAIGYMDPFNLTNDGSNRSLSYSKYRFKNYNDPLNNLNDPYSFNDPMMQFYLDNPNLAPDDYWENFGSAQKYRFKKFTPIRPMGMRQHQF